MSIDAFIDWLIGEAGAGWVFGTVSLIALIASYFRRKRPAHVVVEEVELFDTIEVHKEIRDKVQVAFDGMPVGNLSQFRARVFNSGTNPISADKITLQFSDTCKIIAASLESSNEGEKIGYRDNKVAFSWEYLNPFSDHKHAIELLVLADGELDGVEIRGSGSGWSARHKRLPTRKERRRELRKVAVSYGVILLLFMLYSRFVVEQVFGISRQEWSLRAFLALLPALGIMGIHFYWVRRIYGRLERTRLTRR